MHLLLSETLVTSNVTLQPDFLPTTHYTSPTHKPTNNTPPHHSPPDLYTALSNMDHTDQDIILNRISLAVSRNRAHVASWLSAKTLEEAKAEEEESAVDLEQAFRHLPEDAGLGSSVLYADAEDSESAGPGSGGRKLESGEKFLGTLLGRREAKAHIASRSGGAGGKITGAKSAAGREKKAQERRHEEEAEKEEEEEGGRAAAFGSKKVRHGSATVTKGHETLSSSEKPDVGVVADGEGLVRHGEDALILPNVLQVADTSPMTKKRANTYLDELLSQKAKKAKKKKMKTSTHNVQS